jgi:pimeloyl-ACP methyl ester carboxylesterase
MTSRGRSPWDAQNGQLKKYSAEFLQKMFTATAKYNLWPQASLHTQWPGAGVIGDSIFDAYYASTVPSLAENAAQERSMQLAGAALLEVIGKPVILLAHSQGGSMAWVIADRKPDLVHSIIAIEPSGPPFQNAVFGSGPARPYGLTDIPITYSPAVTDPAADFVKQTITSNSSETSDCVIQADDPPPRRLVNLSKIPELVVTTEASYHATHDWCTVRFLQQAGVPTTHLQLEKAGIHGNGHMVFLEKNSDQVVRVIHNWLEDPIS